MINTQEVRSTVDGIIVEVMKSSGAGRSRLGNCQSVEPQMQLKDFGLDSLDIVELVSVLETKFDVEVSDDVFEAVKTVDDLYTYMSATLAQKAALAQKATPAQLKAS
ncbi:acyl carrier protein [Bradyrhizobium betae]|uniref:acyl carrier protein n=1 Tax=Bradyrhizobium betae TaxID=244734 RepID=UPI003D6785C8